MGNHAGMALSSKINFQNLIRILLDSKPSVYGNVYLLLFIILVFRSEISQCLSYRCCFAPQPLVNRLALTHLVVCLSNIHSSTRRPEIPYFDGRINSHR